MSDIRLIHGDCLDVLPTLESVSFDAVVTDPPYGIGVDVAMNKTGGTQYGVALAPKRHYEATGWDNSPASQAHIDEMIRVSKWQIIFGGNYFSLPPSKCWLVWDKKINGDYADCELAWTNMNKPVRRIEWIWNGMIRQGGEDRNGHPTQKPLGVMKWCLQQLPQGVTTILDPFMGSGTTAVAAIELGLSFVGIEINSDYFAIAEQRIRRAQEQLQLFGGTL